jgi:predicted permease
MTEIKLLIDMAIKMAPLYLFTVLGVLAQRFLKVERQTVAMLIFYLFTPLVVGVGLAHAPFSWSILYLPLVSFLLSSFITLLAFCLNGLYWRDGHKNILALMAGTGNIGYFGLSLAFLIFDSSTIALYIAALFGITLFESSFGFYIAARGVHTARECLFKLLKLPSLYAFIIGAMISAMSLPLPLFVDQSMNAIRGAYVVLGMMLVGMGLSSVRRHMDWPFTLSALTFRFFVWPVVTFLCIYLADLLGYSFSKPEQYCLYLLAIVPLPANSIAIATILHLHPQKVALSVFLSTLIAMIYVPWMIGILAIGH